MSCRHNGACDSCPYSDCIATTAQAMRFYRREEKQARKKYGRGLGPPEVTEVQVRLTEEQKEEIKQALRKGEACASIAQRDDVAPETIRNYKKMLKKEEAMAEQKDKTQELMEELSKLHERVTELTAANERLKHELARKDGLIDGLTFALRCNGISGDNVRF